MNVETVSTFKAKINTVEFHDEKNFNSTRILLEHVESKFGEVYNYKFISDLSQFIQDGYLEVNNYSSSEHGYDHRWDIYHAESFDELKFNHSDAVEFNKKIESGAYNLKHEISPQTHKDTELLDALSELDKLNNDQIRL